MQPIASRQERGVLPTPSAQAANTPTNGQNQALATQLAASRDDRPAAVDAGVARAPLLAPRKTWTWSTCLSLSKSLLRLCIHYLRWEDLNEH